MGDVFPQPNRSPYNRTGLINQVPRLAGFKGPIFLLGSNPAGLGARESVRPDAVPDFNYEDPHAALRRSYPPDELH